MKKVLTAFVAMGLVALVPGVVAAATVGQWTFDSVSGTTVTNDGTAGLAGDGTLNGGATIVAGGVVGDCLSLDGVDGYVSVPDITDFEFPAGQSFSISLWFKTTYTPYAYSGLVTKGYSDSVEHNYLVTDVWNNAGAGATRLGASLDWGVPPINAANYTADGEWHALTFVKDSTAGELHTYIDANAVFTVGGITDLDTGVTTSELMFGRRLDSTYSKPYTNGFMDEINIFDHALSAGEVAALHTLPSVPEDLNGDSFVNETDLYMLRDNWGSESYPLGDLDGSGQIGYGDLDSLMERWGWAPLSSAASVPEPSSMLMLVLGSLVVLVLRRRCRI